MIQKRWLRLMVVWLVPVSVLMAAAVGVGAEGAAKQFTFTVPLQLHRLDPAVKKVSVDCAVLNGGGVIVGGAQVIEDVSATSDGELVKDVVVAFNVMSPNNPDSAKFFRCGFMLSVNGTDWVVPTNNHPTTAYKGTALKNSTSQIPIPAPVAPAQ